MSPEYRSATATEKKKDKNIPSLLSRILPIVVCWWAVVPLAQAVTVNDLYVADVYVTSESESQRLSGARAGLLQVLVRVSGNQDVVDNPQIRAALRSPTRYYYQYSYRATDRTFQVGDEILPGRILRLSFEPNAVASLLRNAGFAVWGSNRPSVLLWVAVQDRERRRIVSELNAIELKEAFDELARARGLPFFYPLLDLEDASRVSEAEVWGAFLDRVEAASVRYNPDSILTGRVQQDPTGQWRASWAIQVDGLWQRLESAAPGPRELLADVVDQLADKLAVRYAVGSARGEVTLRVEDISSVESYANVLKYLSGLSPVLDATVVRVEGSDLELTLSTEGQREQLIQLIELDRQMILLNDSPDRLLYRWLP
jgi:hypothetical protein